MADEALKVDAPVVEAAVAEPTAAAAEPAATEAAATEAAVAEPVADDATGEETKTDTKEEAVDVDSEVKDKTVEKDILKTTRQAHQDRRKNNKFDPSVLPVTDDAAQIRGQV